MTAVLPTDPTRLPSEGRPDARAARASRTWRQIWRMHFYAGIFSVPVLALLAVTGLVILYTGPIDRATHGDLLRATPTGQVYLLDDQRAAAQSAFPKRSIASVTPPADRSSSTMFVMNASDGTAYEVYVDPYTNKVLGSRAQGSGPVGLANRLHGSLNRDGFNVPLPTLGGALSPDEPLFQPVPASEVLLEVFAGWALVLAVSGVYLWWPRSRRTAAAPSRSTRRGRWRNLHAVPGLVLSGLLVFFVTTGLAWSAWWGAGWGALAERVTPNAATAEPSSRLARLGDLDVLGNRIPWGSRNDGVPASGGGSSMPGMDMGGTSTAGPAPAADGSARPAPFSLDGVRTVAERRSMRPGYSIALPTDSSDDKGRPVYGTYVVSNPWPSQTQASRSLYLDQFSGRLLSESTYRGWGGIQKVTDLGVQTHMGTQFGLVDRIVMTLGCVLVLWSCISGTVMWLRRRRKGTLGTPRRPTPTHLPAGLLVAFGVMTVLFPLWGASCWIVLGLDRFVVQKVGPLRRTFGQRDPVSPRRA